MSRICSLLIVALASCVLVPEASARCRPQSLGGKQGWFRTDRAFDIWLHSSKDDPRNWTWSRRADIGDGTSTTVVYRATHAGNGTIRIKNLELRVWREHRGEGFIYRPFAFRVDLRPAGRSRYCELVVSGGVDLLDENDEAVVSHGAVRLIYSYDPKAKRYVRRFARSPIALDRIEF